jgi:ubiquinone/menaquinone biosynthesis C-methylase UbiE
VSDTYSAVDQSADVAGALDWQDRVNGWPQIKAYKQRSLSLVGDRRPVLDVGCGTGGDVAALGQGALGVDASWAMCARAAGRGMTVVQGDAQALPFPDRAFAAVRADRLVQHLVDPIAGLRELVRVTRPGGRIVVCDPDQESLVIALPGVRAELTAAVKRLRRDVGYRNGAMAAHLPAILDELGLEQLTVDAFPLLLTNPEDAFGLPGWPRYFGHAHAVDAVPQHPDASFSAEDLAEWDRGIATARTTGGLVYGVLYFVASAFVPGR